MKAVLRFDLENGSEQFTHSNLPLAVGLSADGQLVLGPLINADPIVWFGLDNNQLYIQPGHQAHLASLNNNCLKASIWVEEGDLIQIERFKFKVAVEMDTFILSNFSDNSSDQGIPEENTSQSEALPSASDNSAKNEAKRVRPIQPQQESSAPAQIFAPLPDSKTHSRFRNITIALFIFLLSCVIFVLVAASIQIHVIPAPDNIALSGFPPTIKIGDSYLAFPGKYNVIATKQGYHDLNKAILVQPRGKIQLKEHLQKLPGKINIISHPVSNAEVKIDGKIVGATPLSSIDLLAGQYELIVLADRYLPYFQTIEIEGMGIAQSITAALKPGWGNVKIHSDPDGAEIFLGGMPFGQTPQEIKPMGGDYQLELRKEGWKSIVKNIRVEAGDSIVLPKFTLQKLDGILDLTSNPPGARLMLDGIFRGQTPTSIAITSEEDHQLSLSKNGFIVESQSVRVERGKTQSLKIELKPEYGIVFITCEPADAQLKLDGLDMGNASRRLRLTVASHQIEISKTGYLSQSLEITPAVNTSKKINIQLQTEKQVNAKKKPYGLTTAGGHILREISLPTPVTFTMGASRRESGRRSNETQYKVQLTKSFWISEKEVTNAEFQKFRPGHNSGSENGFDLNEADQPVTSVKWNDAAVYLNWLSEQDGLPPAYEKKEGRMVPIRPMTIGYRLPTEAEWAYVARFEGGHRATDEALKYPWGKNRTPSSKVGNYADTSTQGDLPVIIENYSDDYRIAAPVGKFTANQAGLYDLGGNVSEWCHDYYDIYPRNKSDVLVDPAGPKSGKYHVVRGSSWRHGSITELRLTYRDYAQESRNDIGFRITRYADKQTNN
ncbi:MAG: PEGA domain-containing protein [Candidatus Omnitrophica bacterium]|nr:PEGA domain-containing protein [Candidatus Omnitrophota bacterium]